VVKNDIFDLVANRFFNSIFGILNSLSFLSMITNHREFFCKKRFTTWFLTPFNFSTTIGNF